MKQLHKAKGEIVISQKRRDKKHRVLRNGENQRADGRYAYKYIGNDGKSHFVYSWKLEKTDPLPSCKRDCEALREKEKRIEKELAEANGTSDIGSITVSDFVELLLDLTPADCKHILKFQNYMVYEHKRALFIAQKKKEREAAKKKNHNSNPLR